MQAEKRVRTAAEIHACVHAWMHAAEIHACVHVCVCAGMHANADTNIHCMHARMDR